MSHTPGPWVMGGISSLDEYSIVIWPQDKSLTGGAKIAVVFNQDIESPDAYLIAAAPDLLAALKAVVENIELLDNPSDQGISAHSDTVDNCRAAIAKAEGR